VATIDLSTVTTAIGLRVLKSGDTMTGPLSLTGAGSYVTTASSMSAAFGGNRRQHVQRELHQYGYNIGNGSGLTNLTAANVSGILTVSSATVTGNAFSVGGSTLVVSGGRWE